jgi:hypothetical protein
MFVKACVAGAVALAFSSDPQALGTTTALVAPNPYIEMIRCDQATGTGFKLADGTWVSANHVTENANCKVDGIPIIVTGHDERTDYSTFTVPGDRRVGGLTPDCSGFKDKGWYWGVGHARGLPTLTAVPVLYSRFMNEARHSRDWAILIYNRFIPGQSGGVVLNQQGEVTGIVNAFAIFFPASFSIALKDTPLCHAPAPASPGASSDQAG